MLTWQTVESVSVDPATTISTRTIIECGLDETGRVYGEVRYELPFYIAFHLRKVVGRYLDPELAKVAVENVHAILITNNTNANQNAKTES